MYDKKIINELNRLNFEDFLWIIFIAIGIITIYGNYNQKMYIKTKDDYFNKKSNDIFEIALTTSLLIYIYFFTRNYKAYNNSSKEEKNLYEIKLVGSSLFIIGILCLLHFQEKQTSFVGSPAP